MKNILCFAVIFFFVSESVLGSNLDGLETDCLGLSNGTGPYLVELSSYFDNYDYTEGSLLREIVRVEVEVEEYGERIFNCQFLIMKDRNVKNRKYIKLINDSLENIDLFLSVLRRYKSRLIDGSLGCGFEDFIIDFRKDIMSLR